MRALVTGGAGFIGSNLVDALVERGDDVAVIDDLSAGRIENVHPKAEFIEGDVSDLSRVRQAVAGCEVVFHLAAHRAVPQSIEDPLATDRANVGGTLTILIAARDAGVKRVISASSSSVYGTAEHVPTPESERCVPRSPYAVSKLAAEHYCRVFWELFGLETVCLRYFNVYGPRQRPDSRYAAVIPTFVDALRRGVAPEVHGDGLQSRDFTFVTDAVAANLLSASAPSERCAGRRYNIAGGNSQSVLEILDAVQAALGTSATPVHTTARPGDIYRSCADLTAARRDLGYVPAVALRDGIARTVAWFES